MIGLRIIDRYLLREYWWTAFVTAVAILWPVHTFRRFYQPGGIPPGCGQVRRALPLLAWFYGCQAVMVLDRSAALISLIAAMFTITWIQRHQEMTALLAAGDPSAEGGTAAW